MIWNYIGKSETASNFVMILNYIETLERVGNLEMI